MPFKFHTKASQLSNKPVESALSPTALPDANQDDAAHGLEALVEHSATENDVGHGIHMHGKNIFEIPWIHRMIPGIEKLATEYHIGNFVVERETGERIFESMPIYARIGMHLLFYGKEQAKLLGNKSVEHLLKEQSLKQGKIFDEPSSAASIPSFVKTYSLRLDDLLEPNPANYKTFNEFFYRKLKPDARPLQNAADPLGICSAADCRITVYPTIDLAKQFWVKGKHFTIPDLLSVPPSSEIAKEFEGASLALFRLAPADYHRFHSPIDCVVGDTTNVEGQYYTVNPQAVNEPGFDVFTANVRSILYLTHEATGKRVAFVAIGALLVGSIHWTAGGEKGRKVKRGEELGYFAYGGSTVAVVFPKGVVEFDQDLVKNSEEPIETLVQVGNSIGKTPSKA